MQNFRNKFLLVICAAFVTSCGFVTKQHIVDNFYLIAVDSEDDLTLNYKGNGEGYTTIIHQIVYEVGNDDDYIIVKQHPEDLTKPMSDTAKMNYYIVPTKLKNPSWAEKEILGPMTHSEFENARKILNIENIKFSVVYENNHFISQLVKRIADSFR